MSGLPRGWANAKIPDVFDVNPGHKGLDIDDGLDVSFVPMTAIEEATGRLCANLTKRYAEIKSGYTKFVEDDVVFAKITPCMENGKAAIAKNLKNGIGCGTTELHVFRTYFKASNSYLLYFLLQESIRESARKSFQGTSGHLRVPVAFFDEIDFPLPPLNEQRRIVAKLEELLAKVDASQQRLAKIPVILKRFRQAVLAAACSGRLTADWREEQGFVFTDSDNQELPPNWKLRLLGDISDVISGFAFSSGDFIKQGVPAIKISNVQYGEFEEKNQEYLPAAFLQKYQAFSVVPLTILMALTRPITNNTLKVCLYPENAPIGLLNQRVCKIVHSLAIDKDYLHYFMQTEAFKQQISANLSETLQPNLSPKALDSFEVLLPPLPEQQEIVRRVESFFTLADQLEARYRTAKTHVDKLTQSILAKAFRGELVPQDPNDEPAAVLLERIHGKRQAEQSKKTPHIKVG